MKRALLLGALALGACSALPDTSHDYYGNVYPADCPPSIVSDPVILSRVDIVREHVSGAQGTTRRAPNGRFIVTLDPNLSGWMLDDVKRHEFAHVKHMMDGNPDGGNWHAFYMPNQLPAPRCADPFHC